MSPIDIPAIERRARQLRAEEIRRIEGLFAERMLILGRLLAGSAFAGVLALAEILRPLFSWNPKSAPSEVAPAASAAAARPRVALLTRANRFLRSLFAWNPEVHHHL
ncbi:MAG: hypothetical protein WC023_00525 [Rhodocyclaceae bacterium]